MNPAMIAMLMQVGGKGLEGYAAKRSHDAAASDAKAHAASYWARARETAQRAAYESWRTSLGINRAMGSITNELARSGVEMRGSATDLLRTSLREMTLDKLMTWRDRKTQVNADRIRAYYAKKQAKSAKKQGRLAMVAGGISAGHSIASSDVFE